MLRRISRGFSYPDSTDWEDWEGRNAEVQLHRGLSRNKPLAPHRQAQVEAKTDVK